MEVNVNQKTATQVVDENELRRRTIRRSDYVSCNQAFIDCRTPGSDAKENYSIIGPGVTQSAQQVVNLREPHGFNIGAAAMPDGVVNNLHLHFTAEVFLNWSGTWKMRWGADGSDGEFICEEGDIVSVPTWIFRGFTNVGGSHGWLFTALGFDNTGGIIWGPSVLKEAEKHGLFLTLDNDLIDTVAGDTVPENVEVVPPLPQAEIDRLRTWTAEQMQQRVVRQRDLKWSSQPFLCNELPGGGAELATVIGYGMTEDRDQVPPIHYPHNFNLAWLRAIKDEGILQHRHDHSQVLMGYRGTWLVTLNEGDHKVATVLNPYDTISVPAGAWRTFTALDDEAQMLVVNSGDGRVRLEWPSETIRHAEDKGHAADAAGYVAAWNVVRYSTIDD
ncbi:hypothetical protein [Arthrobacter sp. CG_A4]|uniref:hypothetical protein n=1 Tax=Arthrobacter sp. CG_A4 TaxID=3071706 RepID=UPI002E0550B6|nr:quercetin dioxygenase-like cupin family protein [Arthrobacter sp. CG_A4]